MESFQQNGTAAVPQVCQQWMIRPQTLQRLINFFNTLGEFFYGKPTLAISLAMARLLTIMGRFACSVGVNSAAFSKAAIPWIKSLIDPIRSCLRSRRDPERVVNNRRIHMRVRNTTDCFFQSRYLLPPDLRHFLSGHISRLKLCPDCLDVIHDYDGL